MNIVGYILRCILFLAPNLMLLSQDLNTTSSTSAIVVKSNPDSVDYVIYNKNVINTILSDIKSCTQITVKQNEPSPVLPPFSIMFSVNSALNDKAGVNLSKVYEIDSQCKVLVDRSNNITYNIDGKNSFGLNLIVVLAESSRKIMANQ